MYITLNTLFCIPNTPPPPPTRENNSTMDIFGISINFQFAYILESGDESADSSNWMYLMNSMLNRRRRRDRQNGQTRRPPPCTKQGGGPAEPSVHQVQSQTEISDGLVFAGQEYINQTELNISLCNSSNHSVGGTIILHVVCKVFFMDRTDGQSASHWCGWERRDGMFVGSGAFLFHFVLCMANRGIGVSEWVTCRTKSEWPIGFALKCFFSQWNSYVDHPRKQFASQ